MLIELLLKTRKVLHFQEHQSSSTREGDGGGDRWRRVVVV
jgi:hypothetical protein